MSGTGIDDISVSTQAIFIEPSVLIDTVSGTEFYIGTSRSFNNPAVDNWRIKKIWQVGTVWKQGYPGGDQGFTFIWDLRSGYVYS